MQRPQFKRLPNPSYSLHLVPCDYQVFGPLTEALCGGKVDVWWWSADLDLGKSRKTSSHQRMKILVEHYKRCIHLQGGYVEKSTCSGTTWRSPPAVGLCGEVHMQRTMRISPPVGRLCAEIYNRYFQWLTVSGAAEYIRLCFSLYLSYSKARHNKTRTKKIFAKNWRETISKCEVSWTETISKC